MLSLINGEAEVHLLRQEATASDFRELQLVAQ